MRQYVLVMGEGGGEGGQQLFDLSDCSDRPHTVHRRPHSCKIEKMLQRGEGGGGTTVLRGTISSEMGVVRVGGFLKLNLSRQTNPHI